MILTEEHVRLLGELEEKAVAEDTARVLGGGGFSLTYVVRGKTAAIRAFVGRMGPNGMGPLYAPTTILALARVLREALDAYHALAAKEREG